MRSPILAVALALALLLPLASVADEEDLSASGFDNMRIEQEEKLLVPLELADDVLAYLKQRYVEDRAHLAALDPLFSTYVHVEDFTDVYYDTPELQLLAMESGVRHRTRYNLTDPEHRKNGRELMQMKINNITDNPLDRGEIKFGIEHVRRPETPDDMHPMLGIVTKEHRQAFKKRLVGLGLDPQGMRPVLTVRDLRTRIYFNRDGKPFLSISFDQAHSKLLWTEYHFVEIEPELNEIGYTDADPETRRYMSSILTAIVDDVRVKYPRVKSNLTPKYNKSFFALEAEIPMLRRLVAMNLHHGESLASLALVAIAALGFGGSLLWRGISAALRQQSRRPERQTA